MMPSRSIRVLDDRQKAYLDAMEIDVWCPRDSIVERGPVAAFFDPENAPMLKLGPGGGGVLLVCTTDTDSASHLANDMARALGNTPVWAWPQAEAHAVKLEAAVEEHLFTTVAMFGMELATRFFGQQLPASLGSARLVILPDMQDIQHRAEVRRELWATFCHSGMVSQN